MRKRGSGSAARTAAAFLRSAEKVGGQREAFANVKRADAFRRVELVRGKRERVALDRRHVDVDLPRALHGIDVEVNCARAACGADLFDRLHDACLVVRHHHRDQARVLADRGDDLLRRNVAASRRAHVRHFHPSLLQLPNRLSHRGMFDRGRDDMKTVTYA